MEVLPRPPLSGPPPLGLRPRPPRAGRPVHPLTRGAGVGARSSGPGWTAPTGTEDSSAPAPPPPAEKEEEGGEGKEATAEEEEVIY